MTALLELDAVVAGFGETTVLHGASYDVEQGEVCALLGLNGAGKSVSLGVAAGLVPARSGQVRLRGRDITGTSAESRVRCGISLVTQARHVLAPMTVEENLWLGRWTRRRDGATGRRIDALLDDFPDLARRRRSRAGTLSGGERTQLAVARALLSEPALLLLDEPSAALDTAARSALRRRLAGLAERGTTVLIVEQNVAFALALADRLHLMQRGQVVRTAAVHELDRAELGRHLGLAPVLTRRPPTGST